MTFGITSEGFNLKRLEDISTETENELKSAFGPSINLDPRSAIGQIKGILDAKLAEEYELQQAVYNAFNPETAEGVSLDNLGALNAIKRLEATKSRVVARITGTFGTNVPVGFIASVAGSPDSVFSTIDTDTIHAGIDAVQFIEFSATPTSGNFKLNFDGQVTPNLPYNVSSGTVQTELNNLSNLSSVTVSGSVASGFTVTFTGLDGEKPQPLLTSQDNTLASPAATITISELTEGFLPFVDMTMDAVSTGPIVAFAGTLTEIDTPLAGVDSITNLIAAIEGRDIESDSDYRQRRRERLARQGTAALEGIRREILSLDNVEQCLIIENDTNSVDIDGRPPHSFESYVYGGDNQEIADAIFISKAAGIQAYGSITEYSIDSNGFSHAISFSRPSEIEIYIIVNITKNTDPLEGDLYPANGDNQVLDAILEYGNTFSVGQDVVVNKFYTPINNVAGVIGIEFLVGLSPSPALSNNIAISATSIAAFSAARITVNS